jgi:hypothetical protein
MTAFSFGHVPAGGPVFVFLRNGERIEIPEAINTRQEEGQILCLDAYNKVLRRFPVESVVMFSPEPWDSLWDVIRGWVGGSPT